MFNFQEKLDYRKAKLKTGKISKEQIKLSLTQAGIMDENGNINILVQSNNFKNRKVK